MTSRPLWGTFFTCPEEHGGRVGGGFPGETQFFINLQDQLMQAPAELRLRFGERGQRVDRREQRAGLFLGDVEHFQFHLMVRVDFSAQVAVDQLEPAVGQFVDEQAAGEADLLVERLQGGTLVVAVGADVELVQDKIAGADAAMCLGERTCRSRFRGSSWRSMVLDCIAPGLLPGSAVEGRCFHGFLCARTGDLASFKG